VNSHSTTTKDSIYLTISKRLIYKYRRVASVYIPEMPQENTVVANGVNMESGKICSDMVVAPEDDQPVKMTKPRKWKSGTVAKREINKLSKTTDNLFPKASFQRLVREVTQSISSDTRYTEDAMMAIHVAAEQFVTDTFVKADLARRHAKRKTLHVNDIQFSKYMTQTTSDIVGNTVEDV
jgi:histone H3/H4